MVLISVLTYFPVRKESRSSGLLPVQKTKVDMFGLTDCKQCLYSKGGHFLSKLIFLTANADRRAVSFTLAE